MYVVKVRSFGNGEQPHVAEMAKFVALGLNRTVGIDRVEIWNDGARFTFDPAAYDGEHDTDDVIAIERPYAPAVNGHDPKVPS